MAIAVISDIHGNAEALRAVLAHARLVGAERFVFLGDIVGYGADPAFAVETVMDHVARGAVALLGNHDEAAVGSGEEDMNGDARAAIRWTRTQLAPEHREFLAGLPLTHEEGDILFVHANAHAPGSWGYIHSPQEASRSFSRMHSRVTICGHVHVPALYHEAGGRIGAFVPVPGPDIPLLPGRRWLAVMGSVGQPRDGVPAASYGLLDPEARTLRYLRVPYDHEAAAAKVRAAGLPERLAVRLGLGR